MSKEVLYTASADISYEFPGDPKTAPAEVVMLDSVDIVQADIPAEAEAA